MNEQLEDGIITVETDESGRMYSTQNGCFLRLCYTASDHKTFDTKEARDNHEMKIKRKQNAGDQACANRRNRIYSKLIEKAGEEKAVIAIKSYSSVLNANKNISNKDLVKVLMR